MVDPVNSPQAKVGLLILKHLCQLSDRDLVEFLKSLNRCWYLLPVVKKCGLDQGYWPGT